MKKILLVSVFMTSFTLLAEQEAQPKPEQGESWGQSDVENTEVVLHVMRKKLIESTGTDALMRRDAHPKHHGCVKAGLEINNAELEAEHRVGLFAQNASYGAVIRFSNGDPNYKKADTKGDARGMALKILGVPYENYLSKIGSEKSTPAHDLVFMNADRFFVKDTAMYKGLMLALDKGPLHLAWFGLTHPKMIRNLLLPSSMKVNNPLDIDYQSATPYKLGGTSMKMKFTSCKTEKDARPKKAGADFLGEKLDAYLKAHSTCFDFFIQPNRDVKKNDIENPMNPWSEKKSPFIKVGRLFLPQQSEIKSPARMEFCQNVSFNPWRAPEENRPLGGVNRTRLEVYVKQAKFRQNYNKVTDPLPESLSEIP